MRNVDCLPCAVRLFFFSPFWFGAASHVECCFGFSRDVAVVRSSAFFPVGLGLLITWTVALVSYVMLLSCVTQLFSLHLGPLVMHNVALVCKAAFFPLAWACRRMLLWAVMRRFFSLCLLGAASLAECCSDVWFGFLYVGLGLLEHRTIALVCTPAFLP